ncbi:MAG: PAS domain S-box protein [Fibrobacteres bacterium]|nr:PAS domain S-box protein [Fibrobacterota bacterium]
MEEPINWQIIAKRKDRLMQYFSQMINSCPIGLVTCYQDGYFLKVNPAAEKILGKGQHQLIGENIAESIKLQEDWHKVIVTGDPHLFKDCLNGFDLLINVMNDAGRIREFIIVFLPK